MSGFEAFAPGPFNSAELFTLGPFAPGNFTLDYTPPNHDYLPGPFTPGSFTPG